MFFFVPSEFYPASSSLQRTARLFAMIILTLFQMMSECNTGKLPQTNLEGLAAKKAETVCRFPSETPSCKTLLWLRERQSWAATQRAVVTDALISLTTSSTPSTRVHQSQRSCGQYPPMRCADSALALACADSWTRPDSHQTAPITPSAGQSLASDWILRMLLRQYQQPTRQDYCWGVVEPEVIRAGLSARHRQRLRRYTIGDHHNHVK